jgi:S-formylglutathione hydrolase FrmB
MNTSLTNGWLPIAIQMVAALVLATAIGWRSPRWRGRWLPLAVLVGVATVGAAYLFYRYQALGQGAKSSPILLWLWTGLSGLAIAVVVMGWPGARWWRRVASVVAVPLCAACAALAVNTWTGYLPTVASVWSRATDAPLRSQVNEATAHAMQRRSEKLDHGVLVSITTPDDASGFRHRDELVYLPAAWFASDPPPSLPAVLMIGGEFGHPSDWPTTGGAQRTADEFAAAHEGNAPILVFADTSGQFSNDTECVNGVRGNAADHLTKELVPYVISHFGARPASWGIAGWSSGGMCALLTTVMHPDTFRGFVDIDGLIGPSAGSMRQTIARLFGGDAQDFADFDPATVMTRQGPYRGVAGWFAVSATGPPVYRAPGAAPSPALVDRDSFDPANSTGIADYLCSIASGQGIECTVVPQVGGHDLVTAAKIFAKSLPWLAGHLGTPGVPAIPLPGAPGAS